MFVYLAITMGRIRMNMSSPHLSHNNSVAVHEIISYLVISLNQILLFKENAVSYVSLRSPNLLDILSIFGRG